MIKTAHLIAIPALALTAACGGVTPIPDAGSVLLDGYTGDVNELRAALFDGSAVDVRLADMPAGGTASYEGAALWVSGDGTETQSIAGKAALAVDFSSPEVTGSITELTVFTGDVTAQPDGTLAVESINVQDVLEGELTANITRVGPTLTGTFEGQDITGDFGSGEQTYDMQATIDGAFTEIDGNLSVGGPSTLSVNVPGSPIVGTYDGLIVVK